MIHAIRNTQHKAFYFKNIFRSLFLLFFTILVMIVEGCHEDKEDSGSSSGSSGGSSGCSTCTIFVTTGTSDGLIGAGGIAEADAFCMADAGYPGTGTYKALIVDGTNRIACTTANCSGGAGEHTDWVLKASTAYVRSNGSTAIGTTTAEGIFSFPLTNSWASGSGKLLTRLFKNFT